MNQDLEKLHPYPFEKLRNLFADRQPPDLPHIALSIGEPKHTTPAFIANALIEHMGALGNYPTTKGISALRETIADWLTQRFQLPLHSIDPDKQVLPVNGTREALFAFAQAVIERHTQPLVIAPNPFYQIYEGAALLAGAELAFTPCIAENHYQPDFSAIQAADWRRCQLLYICSPGNPTGAIIPLETLQSLIELAEKYDFIIASDECYSELYFNEAQAPVGLLQAAAAMGNTAYRRCVVFHSLSKRSNAPGLRSGFVAGDADVLARFLHYRTYHGCAMPVQHQQASITAWRDETHVQQNRDQYQRKFHHVINKLRPVLPVQQPQASFYLWVKTPYNDKVFARDLYQQQHISVLPGSYLSRSVEGINPGTGHVRMALVAELQECVEAAERIVNFMT